MKTETSAPIAAPTVRFGQIRWFRNFRFSGSLWKRTHGHHAQVISADDRVGHVTRTFAKSDQVEDASLTR
jgi:hypothetical protein